MYKKHILYNTMIISCFFFNVQNKGQKGNTYLKILRVAVFGQQYYSDSFSYISSKLKFYITFRALKKVQLRHTFSRAIC